MSDQYQNRVRLVGMAEAWDQARQITGRVGRAMANAGRITVHAGVSAARSGWRVAGATARGTKKAAEATAQGTKRAGKTAAGGARRAGQATRRLTHAQGAGRTGLGRLIEVTAGHSAGDALVTIALAGTLFFGLPVDSPRGPVALRSEERRVGEE